MIELSETQRQGLIESANGNNSREGTHAQITLEKQEDSCEMPPDQDISQLAKAKQKLTTNILSRNAMAVVPNSINNTGDSITIKQQMVGSSGGTCTHQSASG